MIAALFNISVHNYVFDRNEVLLIRHAQRR